VAPLLHTGHPSHAATSPIFPATAHMKAPRHFVQQAPLRNRPLPGPPPSQHRRNPHPRHGHQPHPAASAQASTEPSTHDDDAIEQLKAWIHSHGGYIYPDLVVEPRARCGTRGVAARAPISLDVISSQPLVLVPARLYMTTVAAKDTLNAMPGVFIGDLDPAMQLAIMLAAERAQGAASFWHPYIGTLPERPPCAWCMTGAEVAATCGALQRRMPGLDLPKEVQRVRKQVQMECEIVATAFGAKLGITALDLFWAKGQVTPTHGGLTRLHELRARFRAW
jgi:hypothetical protein